MRLNSIGDARGDQQQREPSGAPPLSIELACVSGAIVAGIASPWLQAWIVWLLS